MTNKKAIELGNQYGADKRTIRRWAEEGAPLDDDEKMREWIQGRKHRPKGFDDAQDIPARVPAVVEQIFWDTSRLVAACCGHKFKQPGFDLGDKYEKINAIVMGPLQECAIALAKIYNIIEE